MSIMKNKITGSLLLLLAAFMLMPQQSTAQNRLYVADFTAAAGKEVKVPIYLDNADEVVGLQFDLEMPYSKPSGQNPTLVDERSNGHSITMRETIINSYLSKFTVVVMSLQNQPLRGNGGLLIRFPMRVPDDAQADDTKPVKLTNIVLTARNGANIATETSQTGTFTVLRTPKPDFTVESLSITNSENVLQPGGKLRLNFNVRNQGTGDSKDGWSEKVYLEDLTGLRTYVTTQRYGNTLAAGEYINRFYEVDIPQAMHIDGTVHAVVELVGLNYTDELIADLGNNTGISENTKDLAKKLFLDKDRVRMNEGDRVSVTLTRSGDWSMDETFELAEVNEHGVMMLSLPLTVTIPAKKAGVNFYVTATNNTEVNAEFRTGLVVRGDGEYDDVSMVVDVDDDDSRQMTLVTDKLICNEGEEVTLTISIPEALANDLKVNISNTASSVFSPYVRSITIPAGQKSASATTTVVNDDYPMSDMDVRFTASATGYASATRTIRIKDDDWPTLSMTLSRTMISEDDGYQATIATVTRQGNIAEDLTIYLNYMAKDIPSGTNTRELYFDSQYVIIPAGQSSLSFPISVEDNGTIEGTRQWTISAAACDAQSMKPVGSNHLSYCTSVLTVTDNDTGVVLKLQCGEGTLTEGGGKVTMTLSRNTNQGDLTVNLTGEGANLDMPSTVTFYNGQRSVTFQVAAKDDTTQDGNYYARVTASGENCQPAQFVFMVSTQPDAVCSLETLPSAIAYGGQTIDATLDVTNKGTSSLQPGMEVRFYLMDNADFNRWGINKQEVCVTTLTETIAPGETKSKTVSILLPQYVVMGQYYLIGYLNPRMNFAESNKGNNLSNSQPIKLEPAITLASVTTDRTSYTRGDVITMAGSMTNGTSGMAMEGKQVDVYLRNDTKRYQVTTTLDADGHFTAQYTFGEQTGGHYKVGACLHGTGGTSEAETTINVIRLRIDQSSYLMQNITEGIPLEGNIPVTNLSDEALTNISFQMTGLPEEWEVEWTSITNLQPNHTGNAHYRIVATAPTSNGALISGTFVATAKDAGGQRVADSEMPVYFRWYAAESKLVADNVRTTLYRNGQRTLKILIENVGIKETGSIGVEWSSNQSWLSVPTTQLASIPKEGRAALTLNLTGSQDMIVDGTYEATVRLKPQNGPKLDVKVKCTVVSTDVANLTVDVVDAYSLGAENGNGPHVAGASVRLTNALTGEVAMTGTTDANGLFYTDGQVKEGTYYVYVTAPNHYYAEKTITLDPGVENQLEVFLNYEVVKISYTVERTTVTDEYRTVVSMDIVPDIPQAIVVPTLPGSWGTGNHAYTVTLTNKGRLTAYTPYLEFPNVEGVTFKVLSDYPALLYPNESYDVTVEFNGPEVAAMTSLGYIRMHYAFKLRGDTYWGSETYAAAMGFGSLIQLPNGGLPMAGSDVEGRNFGNYKPPVIDEGTEIFLWGTGGPDELDSDEPEIEIRDYTHSIDNRVRLQFEQKFLLEREAFKGSLTVENLQMSDIEDVVLVPSVKTIDGTDATDLFSITTTKGTDGWVSGDRWDLPSTGVGQAEVLYVPSKETAPTEPVDYLFGGTVSYLNVSDGKFVTYELTPTQLTVNPSPDLHLTYFVQREFIGDDPLTEEVEPWEPAQFALLIQNKGAGEALNLQIETNEPTIVDNACNLPVKFTKLYCTVDGVHSNMDFNKIDLGSIAAGQNMMLRWWFYCNVSAHVANYNVQMTKHSSFGEEFDLVTIDGIREMTHSVSGTIGSQPNLAPRRAPEALNDDEKQTNIMLLNLIDDEDNLPDHVIDLNGNETDDLEIVSSSAEMTAGGADGQFVLNVTASRPGWAYGDIHDPTNCTMLLERVVRNSDGLELTANFWQTDRTVTSNYSTIVDNRLHWADNMDTNDSYTLYYVPKPAPSPVVKSIDPVIGEGQTLATATKALVTMAQPVDPSSVDSDDISLMMGEKECVPQVDMLSETTFTIDWGKCRFSQGNLTLTVFTSGIKNLDGRAGTTSQSKSWVTEAGYKVGDANNDKKVTITDAKGIVNKILGTPAPEFMEDAADVNGDGKITIADAVEIVNIVVGE